MELYEIIMGLYAVMMVAVIIALTLWIWGEIKDRIEAKKMRKLYMKEYAEGPIAKMVIKDEMSQWKGNAEEVNDGK